MAIQQLYSENLEFPSNGDEDFIENSCGSNLFFLNTQQQQFMQLQNFSQKNQNFSLDNSFSLSLVNEIEKQKLEIDQFVTLQNDRLRLALQELRKQQISYFLKKSELKTQFLLQRKDEEIAKAVNKAMELENLVRRMETENQTWQRVAKEKEAMVMSLKNTIEHLRESHLPNNNVAEDAESCCDIIEYEEEDGERRMRNMVCQRCNYRNSSVIILPCRHLCSCKDCHAFLKSCPVCRTAKKASIEALF
ncbi:probable BOI-related E3 ubiquitin-protein ligase 2 [Olea europaea var. sylvestris]|uniref:Probable BOI-related E3 ubiquitin- ligase 2 n=1 Tax=Olea europaea subsp. europaea TaxID=158383 RepID=A0A8S0VAD7_OLEEU|nr:probable BOI-related E3 ubiquitin-protein ligase 2 [Olea europaea var. sylvestris]XP_022897331.1 probable BOI-related E3 ubiquitin-protein ligase 2 [Olea europaea var. sylvestris]CAA3015928.1 probable BOI-related E3 ubiquitin- ligase 2 [Olea europaea subsp. europaea]CAA3030585.1 probable BOI-related E3 ubiquitin- ligase 2 [Olea europaea subsp. europaea]